MSGCQKSWIDKCAALHSNRKQPAWSSPKVHLGSLSSILRWPSAAVNASEIRRITRISFIIVCGFVAQDLLCVTGEQGGSNGDTVGAEFGSDHFCRLETLLE